MYAEIRAIFAPLNLILLATAALITAVFAYFGIDWAFYTITRSESLRPLVAIAGFAGFFLPAALPLGMYVIGAIRGDRDLKNAAWAVLRAVLFALAAVAILKALTGRTHPEMDTIMISDSTKDFSFGFLRRGIFWGWPSSHAAAAVALSTTLIRLYRHVAVRAAALVFATVVALGAAIGFHWLSDVIAGTIIGIVIGREVTGRSHDN